MKSKYKFLILITIVISITALIYFYSKNQKETNSIPNLSPAKPLIPSYFTDKVTTTFQINKGDFNFPNSLPLITIDKKVLSKDDSISIANGLGFMGDPEEFTDVVDGIKYFWHSTTNNLEITPKLSTVFYSTLHEDIPQVINKNLSEDEIKNIAINFLAQQNKIDISNLKPENVKFLKINEESEGFTESTRDNAVLYKVIFNPKILDYPIFLFDPNTPLTYVEILKDGTVYRSNIYYIENIKKGITNYPIMNYEEVKNSKDQAKIIGVSNIYTSLTDLKASDFSEIKIINVSLIYFWENIDKTVLQPMFLLQGTGKLIQSSQTIGASFYLPAYK